MVLSASSPAAPQRNGLAVLVAKARAAWKERFVVMDVEAMRHLAVLRFPHNPVQTFAFALEVRAATVVALAVEFLDRVADYRDEHAALYQAVDLLDSEGFESAREAIGYGGPDDHEERCYLAGYGESDY